MDYKLIWNEFRNHFGFWILDFGMKQQKIKGGGVHWKYDF